MSQPTPYVKTTDFSDDEQVNVGGRSTVRTDRVDAELEAIELTLSQILVNLSLLQRDDGKIRDAFVELYNLSTSCRAAIGVDINPRGLWSTARTYAVGDLVDQTGVSYLCAIAHTSGVFATDYAAGRWQVFAAAATAGGISFTPTAPMVSTNVQSAIDEVNTRLRNMALPVTGAFYGAL